MKQRYSSIDVHAIANELQKLVGFRLANIYEISNHRSFLLKFHSSSKSCKEFLHIENGLYCHLTSLVGTTKKKPHHGQTPFLLALKRMLKGKRLVRVAQLGSDRILHFAFGFEEYEVRLIAEFYAQGNLIVTDRHDRMLCLLRAPEDTANWYAVGSLYPFHLAQTQPELARNAVLEAWQYQKSLPGEPSLKKFLASFSGMNGLLAEHWLLSSRSDLLNSKLPDVSLTDLEAVLSWLPNLNHLLCQKFSEQKGYLIASERVPEDERKGTLDPAMLIGREEGENEDEPKNERFSWLEYHPFLPLQYAERYYEFSNFSLAVDYYCATLESAKQKGKQKAVESTAAKKLARFESEAQARLVALEQNIKLCIQKAQAIEMNLDKVDQALIIIQLALNAAMDWRQLETLIAEEKKKDNPIALLICRLALEKNQMSLQLEGQTVEIDLRLSAFVNAAQYYKQRRALEEKREKTLQSSDKALASARQAIEREKKNAQRDARASRRGGSSFDVVYIRKPHWFEKFHWFITSEGLLVIAGRNSQQNELLVKKYLKKGDIYIHSEMSGSSSVILKGACRPIKTKAASGLADERDAAGTSEEPGQWTIPPPRSVEQAACLCLCTSSAWTLKILSSAYWVRWDQVSKSPPTGMFLPPGSFMIHGKRHFLPPNPLVYGFGFLFKLDPESTKRRAAAAKALNQETSNTMEEPMSEASRLMESLQLEAESALTENLQLESVATIHFHDPAPQPKKKPMQQKKAKPSALLDKKPKKGKMNAKRDDEPAKRQARNSPELQSEKSSVQARQAVVQSASPITRLPRGKRGKLKKMKEKYKDQDEEDRILSMKLLGHRIQPAEEQAQDSDEQASDAPNGEQESLPSEQLPIEPATEREEPYAIHRQSSTHSGSDSDSDSDADTDPEVATPELLDSLTGHPTEEDVLLYAIPVCGPYTSMARYKYKVKLLPGTLKKEKATRLALESMMCQPSASRRERILLKNVKGDQMVLCMLQSVKLASVQAKNTAKKKAGKNALLQLDD